MKRFLRLPQFILPFALALGILWWMYRGVDVARLFASLRQDTHWGWMSLSLLFGILPLVFRALRWQLALRPLGEHPSARLSTNAIFLSYAASLAVPRVGEVTRCGTLRAYGAVSFSKSLGTVVAERVIDAVLMLLLALVAFVGQLPQFLSFLHSTGTSPTQLFARFTSTGYLVTALCTLLALSFSLFVLRKAAFFERGREKLRGFVEGFASLRQVANVPLYLLYSLGIWWAYYLHFYLAFLAYDATAILTPMAALLVFCVSTFAVLVPTPNGAGPWHFAVKTMLVLYGVAEAPAVLIVLIVHTLQTVLVILLGAWAWVDLLRMKPNSQGDVAAVAKVE